ncbi:MAG: hypothetical protein CTY15_10100 [Methylocystis sp.]|nr:MAG: hypothetical protein CTY15_10100 [Methylocystis sp.]
MRRETDMTSISNTAFKTLEEQGRLLNAVLKGPTEKPGRFGFRGEVALKFQEQLADEKRPPERSVDQVIAIANVGEPTIPFFACYLHSFEWLTELAEVTKGLFTPEGKYFIFCNNIDLLAKYEVEIDGVTFNVLPIDEATVYNELLELLYLDKGDLKKFSTGGKTDAIADAALGFNARFDVISYAQGVAKMGPVRNRNANRPV